VILAEWQKREERMWKGATMEPQTPRIGTEDNLMMPIREIRTAGEIPI
jgi:hypothetical protein